MELTLESMLHELKGILVANAPVRDGIKYPGKRGDSPYPGNLKQNGIVVFSNNVDDAVIMIGGVHAPYAPYTETRSRRKGWQQKSVDDFISRLIAYGGRVE